MALSNRHTLQRFRFGPVADTRLLCLVSRETSMVTGFRISTSVSNITRPASFYLATVMEDFGPRFPSTAGLMVTFLLRPISTATAYPICSIHRDRKSHSERATAAFPAL